MIIALPSLGPGSPSPMSFSNPVDLEMAKSDSPCTEGASGRSEIKKEIRNMVTTEGERGLGGRTTHQEKLRMSLVNVKLGVQKQVNKGKTPRKPKTPKKRGI
jgi:hypothetical protein